MTFFSFLLDSAEKGEKGDKGEKVSNVTIVTVYLTLFQKVRGQKPRVTISNFYYRAF